MTGIHRVVVVTCTLLLVLNVSSSSAFVHASHSVLKSSHHSTSTSTSTFLPLIPSDKNRQVGGSSFPSSTTPSRDSSSMSVSTLQTDLSTVNGQDSNLYKIIQFCADRAPGVALSVALAQISQAMAATSMGAHVSPLLWATILGMAYGNLLHTPAAKQSLSTGIKFSKARLLRLGIILYGFKITLQQIAGIGLAGLGTDIFMVASTLTMGIVLGTKWLGLSESMSTLIGSGAAICGCSAVLATQPVVGKCESHEVSAAVGTVVLGGTLSMFLYPFLFKALPFLAASPKLMGIYTGSTIHEIAGVVAAGNAMGGEVAFTAVVTKLARVLLLAPALTTLSWMQNRKCFAEAAENGISPSKCKLVLPWFAFGFVAVSACNSVLTFPTSLVKLATTTSTFSLLCAMAALGVDSDFRAIRSLGSKPLILAGVLWTWLVVGGLGVSRFFVGV
jgi:uncharacterized integral membrane protein (TIGR00698 family)